MNHPFEALQMPARQGGVEWSAWNQRWLAAQFAALAARLAGREVPVVDTRWPAGFESAHQQLVRSFGLSAFEGDWLLLAAGLECDAPLRAALGALQGGAQAGVGLDIALAHLPGAHWSAAAPLAPLRRWRLLEMQAQPAAFGIAHWRIDERVLHHITGLAAFDARLRGVASRVDAQQTQAVESAVRDAAGKLTGGALTEARTDALDSARNDARNEARNDALNASLNDALIQGAVVRLRQSGPGTLSRRAATDVLLNGLASQQRQALWVDADALPAEPAALADVALLLGREAVLAAATLVLACPEAGPDAPGCLALRRLLPWLQAPALRIVLLGDAQTLSSLEPGGAVVDLVAPAPPAAWLRRASRAPLEAIAQRIESRTRLADLVLPAPVLATLHDITLQLAQRDKVHRDWGFEAASNRGLGLATLFAGDSGTGKTCAAEAIANEVGLDLYRVDLALTVSKYIGETEKNLRRLFDAAEASGAVLLFDEADALFGKRSEVKDSHDRYANIEVAYLLQRMESYRGLAILTTNMKAALDRAFLRRLRFVVTFPFPDEAARRDLWQRQFPPQAPQDADIDWPALARLHLTGGHIRSVVLNAAFHAAAQECAIAQRHLLLAARSEYAKLERSFGTAAGRA